MRRKIKPSGIIFFVIILLLVLVLCYSGLRLLEPTVFQQEGGAITSGKTIERNGVEYFPRQDITTVLLAGIDEDGPVADSGSYNNPGESDMVTLLIFDHTLEQIHMLSLNRDTMMNIPVLGIGGKPAGSIYGQLALAHTYGSGLQDSCENLRTTVSEFLYGINVDYYVVMNMDGIGILNDAVGGVTVEVTEDFSQVDSTIPVGTVTLRGQQAMTYVRSRRGVGDQMNLTRMERQKQYMQGFMEQLGKKVKDTGFILDTYQQVAPYMVTDCTSTVISSLADRYGHYPLGQILTPEGENVSGKQYLEYHVDEEALDKLIVELLYAPK